MTKISTRLREWADHIANDEPALCREAADIIEWHEVQEENLNSIINKQKALLDECERALEFAKPWVGPQSEGYRQVISALSKLRGET